MATNEENIPRVLSDASDTRYIELSTQFEQDVYWHPCKLRLSSRQDCGLKSGIRF